MNELDRLLNKMFDTATIARGRAYAGAGAVRALSVGDREVTARVTGTQRLPYGVQIPISRNTGYLDPMSAACTCPVGVMCKHIVAVMITYYGDLPWGSFDEDPPEIALHRALRRSPSRRGKTSAEILDEIDRMMNKAPRRADTVLSLESGPAERAASMVDILLSARPALRVNPRDRWRVAFMVSTHPRTDRMLRDPRGRGAPPHAIIVPVSQYIRKDGVPGRMEKFRDDIQHEPHDDATESLHRALSIGGLETPLLSHWDDILKHPHLPLYAEGPDGRGSADHPLTPCAISRIIIGFEPEPLVGLSQTEIKFRPVLRATVDTDDGGTAREIRWIDYERGRLIACVGDRWLGWCDGEERLLTFVFHLSDHAPQLSRGDVAELKKRFDAENNPLISLDVPYSRLRLVTKHPQADLLLQEDEQGVKAFLSFQYPTLSTGAEAGPAEERVIVRPDPAFENNLSVALLELFRSGPVPLGTPMRPWEPENAWKFDASLAEFLTAFGEGLLSRGIGLSIGDPSNRLSRAGARLQIRVSSGIDWFDLSASAGEDIDLAAVDPLDPLFNNGFVRNGDRIIYIGAEEAEKLRAVIGHLDPSQRTARVSRLDLDAAAMLHDLVQQDAPLELARAAEIARALSKPAALARARAPTGFQGTLRDYQRVGFGWLSFLAKNGLNGCLADDMGLGKTVQALALLLDLKSKSRGSVSLVVAPVSTLQNWKAEAGRFTPGLRTLVHHGTDRRHDAAAFKSVDLVIVSYATLRVDQELFQRREWAVLILDEAQSIKNPASQSFGVVKQMKSKHRFTLTGTPLENSVIDLWAQIDFLEPGLLGSLARFKKRFASRTLDAPDPERLRLKRLVAPFILRRTKEVVEKSLPKKEEVRLYAEMGARQMAAYNALKEHYRRRILLAVKTKGVAGSGALIFEGLLRLRQAACIPEHANPSLKGVPAAKLDLLQETLAEIVSEGHRVLVFSQFVQSLKSIAAGLGSLKLPYAYLDGSTRNRQEIIDRFQTDPSIPLFLLSLKAGGLGINLTAADYVVLFDPWWNPAVERQAVDRSHRIGQSKPVFVYRLITRDSIEERILALQEKKSALAAELIEENSHSLLGLGEQELMGLFS